MFNLKKIIGVNSELLKFGIKVGEIILVRYESSKGYWRIKTFLGICISKRKKNINTKIILRNLVVNVIVEYDFFLCGPDVINYVKIRNSQNLKKKGKLYFLRKKTISVNRFV